MNIGKELIWEKTDNGCIAIIDNIGLHKVISIYTNDNIVFKINYISHYLYIFNLNNTEIVFFNVDSAKEHSILIYNNFINYISSYIQGVNPKTLIWRDTNANSSYIGKINDKEIFIINPKHSCKGLVDEGFIVTVNDNVIRNSIELKNTYSSKDDAKKMCNDGFNNSLKFLLSWFIDADALRINHRKNIINNII